MNTQNYKSFNTAYSTLKIQKGCKGIGCFLWLKAFKKVNIKSTYFENDQYHYREFTFSADGVEPEDNIRSTDNKESETNDENIEKN